MWTISLKVGDRLRLLGRVRQISIDAVLPIILLPLMFGIAAINFYFMIGMCIAIPLMLGYAQWLQKSFAPQTKFFFMWSVWSGIYLYILFEFTVPLMELLPEENFIFITTMFAAGFCFYKVCFRIATTVSIGVILEWLFQARQRAVNDYVAPLTDNIDIIADGDQTRLLMDIEEEDETNESKDNFDSDSDQCDFVMSKSNNICPKCRRYIPPRAFHCKLCQQCVAKRDHHSIWLDCCIGESNHKLFLAGCLLAVFALLFGANLSMTSICHPFIVFRIFSITVLLPDDCSDVFGQYEWVEMTPKLFCCHEILIWTINNSFGGFFSIALCFVGSIYATVMAICCVITLIQQFYFILKGVTASEWSRGEKQF